MQEAYHPLCSEYSFCCPNWVPPCPDLAGGLPPHPDQAGGGTLPGYPPAGYPLPLAGHPRQGIPLAGYTPRQGTPRQGTLPSRVPPGQGNPPWLDLAGYPPGVCPMEFCLMLQSIMGYGYPPQVWTN